MRWVIAPLAAAFLFVSSGWLNELEETTTTATKLAAASRSAPRTTEAAAEEVNTLPALAEITHRQAVSFAALADALAASGRRVRALNESISGQVSSLGELRATLGGFDEFVACTRRRLATLVSTAGRVPRRLDSIADVMRRLAEVQAKSIRHLRSINRKLTVLGIAATATDVKVPPAPEGGSGIGGPAPPDRSAC